MEQDKTKILSDLYAIRATMSVVAERDDAIQPERDAIAELKKQQVQRDSEIGNLGETFGETLYQKANEVGKQIEALQKEREVCEKKVETARESFSRCVERLESVKKRSLFRCLWMDTLWYHWDVGPLGGVFLVILIVASIAVSLSCGEAWGDWLMGYLYNSLICALVILVYIFGLCVPIAIYTHKDDIRRLEKYIDEYEQEIEQSTQRIQEVDAESNVLKEVHNSCKENVKSECLYGYKYKYLYCKPGRPLYHCAEIDELIQEHEEKVAKLEGQKEELEKQKSPLQEMITANAEKTALIVKEGTDAYPLIDFRDWENVDLLIYYFETGRADDMKEALQLVDRQRQTDQITRALSIASASICKTFDNTMRQLGSSLAQSFTVLSRQMARQHAEMMYRMDQQAADWREMSEAQNRELRGLREQAAAEMSMQVSAQAMNQALLDKISVSSKHLAEQMDRQMREVHGLY